MSEGRVICVGSINVDDVVECDIPRPGETVLAHAAHRGFGGKGANQAAAAARFGAATVMIGAVGDDAGGPAALDDLSGWGVDTTHVRTVTGASTGRAIVLLDNAGENAIVVVAGANGALTAEDVTTALRSLAVRADDVVLAGAEIPTRCVDAAARIAVDAGAWLVHNLAPARALEASVTGPRSVLVVNELEARQVAGVASPDEAWDVLLERVGHVVVTRGARGAELRSGADDVRTVPASAVTVVDTTGAGDAFCGAFAAVLAAGGDLGTALRSAVAAGGVAVTAAGARGALRRRDEPG